MVRTPVAIPLDGLSFEAAAAALAEEPGFVAIDGRAAGPCGRPFSIIAARPQSSFALSGAFVTVDGRTAIDSPKTALSTFLARLGEWRSDPYLPFSGGAIGYIGFEGARALKGFAPAPGFSRIPQCRFGIYPRAVIFDHREGTATVVANGEEANAAIRSAGELAEQLTSRSPASPRGAALQEKRPPAPFSLEKGPSPTTIEAARSWMRSDAAERIHAARRAVAEAGSRVPLDLFLEASDDTPVRALFIHEGAGAVATAEHLLLSIRHRLARSRLCLPASLSPATASDRERERLSAFGNICSPETISRKSIEGPSASARWCEIAGSLAHGMDPLRALLSLLPASEYTGAPLKMGLEFACQHEPEHRALYGGAFGTADAAGLAFWSAGPSSIIADGRIIRTDGIDLTP